jgi:DNA modification methylase
LKDNEDMKTNPADKVERWPLERLVPYAKNSRTHSDAQVAQIAASIREWGWTTPILVDEAGSIIAGHGRLQAARRLQMTEVPVVVASGWSEAQKRAYVIADNKLALNAGWDEQMLALELGEIGDLGFDLDLTGFTADEIAALMPEQIEPGLTDEDAVPEAPAVPRSVLGDVWLCGKHRVMCGDSTSVDAVGALMSGEKADMVFTDPPYGMFLDTDFDAMFAADKAHRKTGKRFDDVAGDHDDFAPELISTIFAAFPDAGEVFIWGADYFSELIPGRKDGSWVVWDKRTNENMDKVSGNTFELCWSKKKHKRLVARILWSGHHGMAKDDTKTRVHPTQKPVELVTWFFEQWGDGCETVADVFGGSGSTLIACEKTGRIARLMELDPKYCDVIVKRWQDFTGQKAVHADTGKTFEEVAHGKANA